MARRASQPRHESVKRKVTAATKRAVRWGDRRLPPGLRSLLGLALMAGGVFGFLPVLGFWMLPIGAALIALDIPPLRRRLMAWQKARSTRRGAGQRKPKHRVSGKD